MARIWRHRRTLAAAFAVFAAFILTPAFAEDRGPNAGTDLYNQPVLAVDPGMHTATLTAQAVDAEGRYAVTGGKDRTVRIWSVADGKVLRTIFVPVGPDPVGQIYAVAISPDGSTIAAGGWTERLPGSTIIYLFDRESGALVRRIGGLPNVVNFLRFSPDGRYLGAMRANGLRVFDREKDWSEASRTPAFAEDRGPNAGTDLYDRPVLAVDPGMHTSAIHGLAIDRDGRFAVTGGEDGTVRVWSVADGELVRTIWVPLGPGSIGSISTVAISPDGSTIAAGGLAESLPNDSPVYLFDLKSGAMVHRILGREPHGTHFLTFSPNGRYLAATLTNGGLRVFDRDRKWSQSVQNAQGGGGDSYGASFAPDGRLATTSFNGHGYHSPLRLELKARSRPHQGAERGVAVWSRV